MTTTVTNSLLGRFSKRQCSKAFLKIFIRQAASDQEIIVRSPHPTLDIPKIPLHAFVWNDYKKWSDKICVVSGETGRKFNYEEARKRSRMIAAALRNEFNLSQGDCIALVSPNVPDYLLVLLGSSEAGTVCSTVNSNYKAEEISKQLIDSKAKVLISSPKSLTTSVEAVRLTARNIPIVLITDDPDEKVPSGGVHIDKILRGSEFTQPTIKVSDNVVLPYSSGTTGLPKGVQLTHSNIVSNLMQIDYPGCRLLDITTVNRQDTVLGLLPFYHIYGMVTVALTTIAGGGKLVTMSKFDPKRFTDISLEHKIELLYLVPPLILFLAAHPSVKPEHLKYMRRINSGAAPIGSDDLVKLKEKAPQIIITQGYGLTETSPVVLTTMPGRENNYASSGVALPNTELMVVDPKTGKSLGPNQVGELYIRGPQVMKGYLNNPGATAEVIKDGWFTSGDLSKYDEDGNFYIVDRLKELIKVKALQVAPAELEAVLRTHPAIFDAGVIGIPDERAGEVPKAFVVLHPEVNATEEDIKQFVANRLSEHKQLKGGVEFVKNIPKSPAGKILRKELRLLQSNSS